MEKELAILICDLSGYTALTEVHGAGKAADMIDTYITLVEESLVGGSRLHERTGDEVMLVAEAPDDLLSTAILLLSKSHREKNFLLLHGGLHWGKLLKRKSGYFGAALNFTARIAANATPGAMWCSKEFRDAIKNYPADHFVSKGKFGFKNMSGEREVFEIIADKQSFYTIDPVCRMLIISETHAVRHPLYNEVFFCSKTCLEVFDSGTAELPIATSITASTS